MKARYFLLVGLSFLLFFLSTADAQIGIKAGAGVSDIAFLEYGQQPYLGYDAGMLEHRVPMPTFQAGIFYSFPIGKRFEFQPELLYITQGLDYSTEFLYDDVIYKIKISYLHAPLLLKYRASFKRQWRPYLFGGPYFSGKLKSIRMVEADGEREETDMPNVRGLDVGVVAGYSAEFGLPAGTATAGIRISYSLANMMDRVDGYIREYDKGPEKEYARNISITLLAGYRFSGKKDRK